MATSIGQLYLLGFYVGSATNGVNIFPSTVDLSVNGGARISFTNPSLSTITLEWAPFSFEFTATGTQTMIAF